MTVTDFPDHTLSVQIEDLRRRLLDSGYQHARRSGELVGMSDNGTEIHVRTGYVHGSYRVVVFGRDRGERQGQHFLDFNRGTSPARIVEVTKALTEWDGQLWPPHPDFRKSETGQGKGWPQ